MFVQDFKIVDRPYEEAAAALATGAGAVLEEALRATRREAERLKAGIGHAGWPPVLSADLELRTGPVRDRDDAMLVAFGWESPREASLLPRLDADLEVAPFGAQATALALRGRYEPLGGILAQSLDRVLLHRLAEATMRSFLDAISLGLTAERLASPALARR